jgi:hypothetical protein
MSPQPTLYLAEQAGAGTSLRLEQIWQQSGGEPLDTGYAHLVALEAGGVPHLIGIDAKGAASAFKVSAAAPFVEPVPSALELAGPWDIVEPFVLGNIPHLLCYEAAEGNFSFFPLDDQLASRRPYDYQRRREPGITKGFSVAKPIVLDGAVYYLGYSFDGGQVHIYSLAATATSAPSSAPLVSEPVWIHEWARKWTRFAFFELGGETFFLKTNVGKLNVNIDHVRDEPADGTVEVGTYLKLEDALDLEVTESFYLGGGDPYFVAYLQSGKTTVNRFDGNCLGWTQQAQTETVKDATRIVPVQTGEKCLLLFY